MRRPPPSASMYVALRASQATRPPTRAGSPCRSCSRGAGCGCCSSFGSAFLAFAPFRLFPLPGFNVVSDSLADPVRLHPQLLDAPERVSARHRQHPFQTLTEPVEPRPLRRLEALRCKLAARPHPRAHGEDALLRVEHLAAVVLLQALLQALLQVPGPPGARRSAVRASRSRRSSPRRRETEARSRPGPMPRRPLPRRAVSSRSAQGVLSELRARMTRSEAPSLLPCLRRRHFGDQCMPAPDEASSLLGRGDDLAAATASAQVLAELLKRRAEACR